MWEPRTLAENFDLQTGKREGAGGHRECCSVCLYIHLIHMD